MDFPTTNGVSDFAALRRELAAIETAPDVLVEPDDYWQVILAQVEEGIL